MSNLPNIVQSATLAFVTATFAAAIRILWAMARFYERVLVNEKRQVEDQDRTDRRLMDLEEKVNHPERFCRFTPMHEASETEGGD